MAYTSINDPSAHFQVKTYSGNGTDNTAITNDGNSNLQPDWWWVKRRTGGAASHGIFDSTRGVTKRLNTNLTNAEDTVTDRIKSFDTNGFTLGTNEQSNASGSTYVAWQWKANGGTTSSNTDGSITSTVQANTDAGFSIVTYSGNSTSGATIGHGLGVAPNWIIVKSYDLGGNWMVGSTALDSTLANRCVLNSSGAASSNSGDFNAAPTSSVFQVGTSLDINGGKDYIAYCFAEKQGYSKFGKYFGNGSSNGTFVYTGFKPRWIIQKNTSTAATSWFIYDSKRDTGNPLSARLAANTSDAETSATYSPFDFYSNGFKLRDGTDIWNESGSTHIYMAFAENPFVTSTGIPTTAR